MPTVVVPTGERAQAPPKRSACSWGRRGRASSVLSGAPFTLLRIADPLSALDQAGKQDSLFSLSILERNVNAAKCNKSDTNLTTFCGIGKPVFHFEINCEI